MRHLLWTVLFLLVPPSTVAEPLVQAGTCTVQGIIRTAGKPRGPVVVYVLGEGPAPTAPTRATIEQRNKSFDKDAVVVSEGAHVEFPNADVVYHHLYSHTPGNAFEFDQHPRGDRPARQFDRTGDVKVNCNIHENMETHVLVLPNAWAVEVDDGGAYTLKGVAPGRRELEAWSAWHEPRRVTIDCRAGQVVSFDTKLRWRSPVELSDRDWDLYPSYD